MENTSPQPARVAKEKADSHLLENAKSAIIGAIELHNKPIFPCRYELAVVLTINAWELAFKAYILQNSPSVKVIKQDGTTKPFEECVGHVASELGKDFLPIKESIDKLYEYRCNIIHFYGEGVELILYSILRPNILFFSDFLLKHFKIDLGEETNLIILPIGFRRSISPVDFLSKGVQEGSDTVKQFINSIVKSSQNLLDNGLSDGILCDYKMSVVNENRINNADIIAGITTDPSKASLIVNKVTNISGITNDKNAPKVQVDEVSLFRDKFNINHKEFISNAKKLIPGFRVTSPIQKIITEIKADPDCFKARCLDVTPNPKSIYKGFYSKEALDKLVEVLK